jgi:predicted amidohydrolase
MKVSLIQMDSRDNKELNFNKTKDFLIKSLTEKPDVICLSEMFLYWGDNVIVESEKIDSKYISFFKNFAKENEVNLILGSVALKNDAEDSNKITNSAFVINRMGKIIFKYDKLFLYTVKRKDLLIEESNEVITGNKIGLCEIDGIKIGIGICFDLRYPEYFKALTVGGAEIIFLPASFRKTTGLIAWNHLTIARAIENQIYFCACNQTGDMGLKEKCGQSRIVSFNGKILNEINDAEGIISFDLDLNKLKQFREEFPILKQNKFNLDLN